ncbi:MAG: TonB-dependent receptor plug domain-containing protein, partial [Paraglaciecola chathamensis]
MTLENNDKFKKHPIHIAICGLLLSPCLPFATAHAQEEASQVTEQGATEADVEKILVFARKRGEEVKDVPVSLSAMSSDALAKAGVSDITSLFALMPGVENNADGSRIANKPAIRGVGSTENSSIRAKVTTFVDGMPIV